MAHLLLAKKHAALRIVIVGGRLYVDLYYDCVRSRAMFTIWGFLQMLRKYPGMMPDVDKMFDCMDKPVIRKKKHKSFPLPLFRYCTNKAHFDIPFPDWSFWGWPEENLGPWNEEFRYIKQSSQTEFWSEKTPLAYWKGNPDVLSSLRLQLMKCNDSKLRGSEILHQNWGEETNGGFLNSKLSNLCNQRDLRISSAAASFVDRTICLSLEKIYVNRYNLLSTGAVAIGQAGQDLMDSLSMDRVYDYMLHLITGYSKLLEFKPVPPPSAAEACVESLLCLANKKQRQFLEKSLASPLPNLTTHAQFFNMSKVIAIRIKTTVTDLPSLWPHFNF